MGGEDSDLGVPVEWTSWLLCFLIPLCTEQQGQGGRDNPEGIVFSLQKKVVMECSVGVSVHPEDLEVVVFQGKVCALGLFGCEV